MENHYTYIVECSDGSLYTGYTTDVERRIDEHNNKEGAKYTRSRTPVTLVRVEIHPDRSSAMSREYSIKQLSREQKDELVPDTRDRVRIQLRRSTTPS